MSKINNIIWDTPGIDQAEKEFYTGIIKARKEAILDYSADLLSREKGIVILTKEFKRMPDRSLASKDISSTEAAKKLAEAKNSRASKDGWNDKAERNYLLCTQVGCSERGDAENIINALIGSVSNLAVSDGQTDLGWKTDTSAWFSSRPVPSLKRNSLFAELLYRIVYRDSLRIGICRNCGAPFLQSGIGSLNDVCSQACRMAQRRRKGLA